MGILNFATLGALTLGKNSASIAQVQASRNPPSPKNTSPSNKLLAVNDEKAFYRGIYCLPNKQDDRTFAASCTLTITGRSRSTRTVAVRSR